MNPPPGSVLEIRFDDPSFPWRGSSIHLLVGQRDIVLEDSFLRARGTDLSICWDSVFDEWPDLWEEEARFVVVPSSASSLESP